MQRGKNQLDSRQQCDQTATCDEDRFWLLRSTATAAERLPVCLQTRVPDTSIIARPDAAGPR